VSVALAQQLAAAGAAAEAGFSGEVDEGVLPCGRVAAWLWTDIDAPPRPDAEHITVIEGEAPEVAASGNPESTEGE
jgi:hypothetical protein